MRSFHPTARLSAVIAPLVILMFARNLPAAAVGTVCGLLCLLMNDGGRVFAKALGGCLLISFLTALTDPLVSHRGMTVLLFINGRAYTLESMLYGLELGLSLGGVMVWLGLLRRLVSERELLCIFGRISPKLAMTVSMTLGFIPRLLQKQSRIREAQRGAGLFHDNSPTGRMESSSQVFIACAAWSAETAAAAARSMTARGYGTHPMTYSDKRPLRAADILLIAFQGIGAVTAGVFSALGAATVFFPTMTQEKYSIHLNIAFALICIPALAAITAEVIRWAIHTPPAKEDKQ